MEIFTDFFIIFAKLIYWFPKKTGRQTFAHINGMFIRQVPRQVVRAVS